MRKNNEINNLKKISHKSIQKDDLCKKYFYKLNLSPKKNNIFQLMENGLSNQDDLEQVDNVCTKLQKQKNELEKKQIECMKSMILHHKQIPERWIMQENYKDLLQNAMQDPIVLSYAIVSKDIFKKRSTSVSIEELEIEKNLQTSPTEPRFISYINPYKKINENSPKKLKLMRDYCFNIKNKQNRIKKNAKNLKLNYDNINNENNFKEEQNNLYRINEDSKENILPSIYPNLKDKNNNNKKEDINETLMMTSLYYNENNINNENKDKINNENNNTNQDIEENNGKNIYNRNTIELPLIN